MPFEKIISPPVEEVEAGLGKQIQALDRVLEKPHAGAAISETDLLKAIGRVLWRLSGLSAEEVLDALEEARDEERPLRLVVSGEATQHLPWELLYHDHPALGFLSRHPWCVLARRIRGSGKRAPRIEAPPLRLLLFVASPEDLDPERSRLDFEREEELLFSALDRPLARGYVDIDVAEDGVLETLRTRLEEHRYHAVIFSMHGTEARNRQGKTEWGFCSRTPGRAVGRPWRAATSLRKSRPCLRVIAQGWSCSQPAAARRPRNPPRELSPVWQAPSTQAVANACWGCASRSWTGRLPCLVPSSSDTSLSVMTWDVQ